jgi:hypothetical protein
VAYEALTGRPAFDADTMSDLLVAICSRQPVPPSRIVRSSTAVDAWFARALAKAESDRFRSGREMLAALHAAGSAAERRRASPRAALWLLLALAAAGAIATGAWRLASERAGTTSASGDPSASSPNTAELEPTGPTTSSATMPSAAASVGSPAASASADSAGADLGASVPGADYNEGLPSAPTAARTAPQAPGSGQVAPSQSSHAFDQSEVL